MGYWLLSNLKQKITLAQRQWGISDGSHGETQTSHPRDLEQFRKIRTGSRSPRQRHVAPYQNCRLDGPKKLSA